MNIRENFFKTEMAILCLKIAVAVFIVEGMIMFLLFPIIEGQLTPFWENLLDPVILALVSGPIIAIWAIHPYVQRRDQAENELCKLQEEAKKEHALKEQILSQQAEYLREAVNKATEELRYSEQRYEMVTKATNDGLWDWKVHSGEVYFSSRWKEIVGYNENEFPNDKDAWFARVHPEDKSRVASLLMHAVNSKDNSRGECTYRLIRKDDSPIWVQSRWITVKDGSQVRLLGAQTDISDRKRMEDQLIYDSLHDGLTGLPNRGLLYDRIEQVLLRFRRNPAEKFVLLFIDVDNFKRLNDSLGHLAGDKILQTIGERLKTVFRDSDTVARLGGDEFAVLMPYFNSQEDIVLILRRLIEAINKPIAIGQTTTTPNVSIGVVVSAKYHQKSTPEKVLMDADMALYKSKETRKGSYSFFKLPMRDKMAKQFEIENCLKGAVSRGEIFVFYQPIVDGHDHSIVGFEALIRWKHPRHGYITPMSFIPVAEESETINILGKYVLDQALAQLKKWTKQFKRDDWYMSVNVSGKQFEKDDVVGNVRAAIQANKLRPEQVQIELTESVLITSQTELESRLQELSDLGVMLAMDDFGTGYSSLATFSRYPFDTIKIDKSFVDGISSDGVSQNMVDIIQTLATAMSLKTVAEGVEHVHQLETLKEAGCRYIQGFYYSMALPAGDMTKLLNISMSPLGWHVDHEDNKVS